MAIDDSLKVGLTAAWIALHGGVAGGGGGPHDPSDMEPRLSNLEAGMKDVKASQQRIEEMLKHVATKADAAEVKGTVSALDAKVSALHGGHPGRPCLRLPVVGRAPNPAPMIG